MPQISRENRQIVRLGEQRIPPAAGRFSGIIPLRRSALPARGLFDNIGALSYVIKKVPGALHQEPLNTTGLILSLL